MHARRSFALSSAPTRLRFRGYRGQTLTNAARISRHSASNVTDRQLACELALRLCTATCGREAPHLGLEKAFSEAVASKIMLQRRRPTRICRATGAHNRGPPLVFHGSDE